MIKRDALNERFFTELNRCVCEHGKQFHTDPKKIKKASDRINQAYESLEHCMEDDQFKNVFNDVLKILGISEPNITGYKGFSNRPVSNQSRQAQIMFLTSPITRRFLFDKTASTVVRYFKETNNPDREKIEKNLKKPQTHFKTMFETSEHQALGEKLKIRFFSKNVNGYLEEQDRFRSVIYVDHEKTFQNKTLTLSLSQIIAYGGDFFGLRHSIKTTQDFISAYNKLAQCANDQCITEINNILSTSYIKDKALNGYVQELYLSKHVKDYFSLIDNNVDHFHPWSERAYRIGHQAAMDMALKARTQTDPKKINAYLTLAYQMEAFACHYLTDHFSGGHLRVGKLRTILPNLFGTLGSILVNDMHNEDSENGVWCEINGQKILVKGDGHLNDPDNKENKAVIQQAVQMGMDDIWNAYHTNGCQFSAMKDLPKVLSKEEMPKDKIQTAPMFKYEGGRVLYRSPITDLNPNNVEYEPLSYWAAIQLIYKLRILGEKPTFQKNNNNIKENILKKVRELKENLQKQEKQQFCFFKPRVAEKIAALQAIEEKLNRSGVSTADSEAVKEIFKKVKEEKNNLHWDTVFAGFFSHRVYDLFKKYDAADIPKQKIH